MTDIGVVALAAGISVLTGLGAGLGMGLATARAVEAVARQPEASGKINSLLILGLALTESTAIYGFVTALVMIFTMGK